MNYIYAREQNIIVFSPSVTTKRNFMRPVHIVVGTRSHPCVGIIIPYPYSFFPLPVAVAEMTVETLPTPEEW